MMRAAVYHGKGDLRIESVPEPADPGRDEILIEVRRAAICGTDSSEFSRGPRLIPLTVPHPGSGHVGPMVIGHEFVGEVSSVGSDVDRLDVGSRVVSGAGISCGKCDWCIRGETNLCRHYFTLGLNCDGGMAEAVVSPAGICHPVPEGMSDEDASMAQPLAVAIHALEKGEVQTGNSIAIFGIGGIGALMLGAAASREVKHLIAIDVDSAKLDKARTLGADETIDATEEQVEDVIREVTDGIGVDVAFEASGAPASASTAIRSTRRGGAVVIVGHPSRPTEIDLAYAGLREIDLVGTLAHICGSDIPAALRLLDDSPIASAVLDRVIPIDHLVDQGLVPLAEGKATGKIVVDVTG